MHLVADQAQWFQAAHLHRVCDPPENVAGDVTMEAPTETKKSTSIAGLCVEETLSQGEQIDNANASNSTPSAKLAQHPSLLYINDALPR